MQAGDLSIPGSADPGLFDAIPPGSKPLAPAIEHRRLPGDQSLSPPNPPCPPGCPARFNVKPNFLAYSCGSSCRTFGASDFGFASTSRASALRFVMMHFPCWIPAHLVKQVGNLWCRASSRGLCTPKHRRCDFLERRASALVLIPDTVPSTVSATDCTHN